MGRTLHAKVAFLSYLGRFDELFATIPYLPKRVQALRLFSQTTYYQSVMNQGGEAGLSKEECDAQVADLLAVFR